MSSKRSLNRKQFLALTVSTVAASTLAACGEDTPAPVGASGSGGTGGTTPIGGTPAAGTSPGGSSSGSGGTPGGGAGSGSGGGGAGGAKGGAGGASGGGAGGASGGGGAGGAGGGMCGADIMVTASGDHPHTLLVTAAQIGAGAEVTIQTGKGGTGDHTHYVKITAADFTMLKTGAEVTKKSCSGGDHEYVLKCGGGGSAPGAPTCNDECGSMAANACGP